MLKLNSQSAIRNPQSRTRGFTLIEILCVVVILGIASAIIIPQIGSRDDLVAASAARVIMADMIYAQNRAIVTQQSQYVSLTSSQYTLMQKDASSVLQSITNPVTQEPYTTVFGGTTSAFKSVSIDSWSLGGPSVIGFDELGSPFAYDVSTATATPLTSAGTIVVKVGSASLTISIEPFTGEATVN